MSSSRAETAKTSISIHALLAESDGIRRLLHGSESISIHALLAESDYTHPIGVLITEIFLSTLSLRRATSGVGSCLICSSISIHALLAESDSRNGQNTKGHQISIHALLAESDIRKPTAARNDKKFLSTLSLRRATCSGFNFRCISQHFYPRSPCGERR